MSEIKRYDLEHPWEEGDISSMEEWREGEWVRYTDHLAAVEAAVMAERASCVEACLAVQRTSAYPEEASGAEDCADAIRARTTQPAKEAG